MNIPLERKLTQLNTKKNELDLINEIEASAESLERQMDYDRRVMLARKFRAASRIQGLIRGFLGRLLAAQLRLELKSSIVLQSLVRGFLGRKRWMYEYWKKVSVVKSIQGLEDLLARSTLIRETKDKPIWREYFDPLSNCFWYYEPRTRKNMWDCPVPFQKNLVCPWNGFKEYGGLPSQKKCRCVFDTVIAYQNHMRFAHRWYCAACDSANSGLVFPVCSTCQNTLSSDGVNIEQKLSEALSLLQSKVSKFLVKDKAAGKTMYSLKTRLIDKTLSLRNRKRLDGIVRDVVEGEIQVLEQKEAPPIPTFTSMLSVQEVSDATLAKSLMIGDDIIDEMSSQASDSSLCSRTKSKGGKTSISVMMSTLTKRQQKKTQKKIDEAMLDFKRTASVYDDVDGPVKGGVIPPTELEEIFSSLDTTAKIPETITADDATADTSDVQVIYNLNGGLGNKNDKLQICKRFTRGKCLLKNCPLAHPGLRDTCVTYYARIPGQIFKVPYVLVCSEFITNIECQSGAKCACYHPYIRPSTEQIIRNLYQKTVGTRFTKFPSGAVIEGAVNNDKFNGHAIMTWPNASTYMGNWVDNQRCGLGIFRSVDGIEYHGEWKEGIKNGFGVLTHPNGEEYVGEFKNGFPDGVGELTSKNGDKYSGQFVNAKYEGVGLYITKVGGKYLGHFVKGQACGIGIQALINGEKYKGEFDRNKRHGKGVCAYKNGSRYSGEWYRGVHEGFGIYVTSTGERYIGEWRASMKDGKGRYYFENGDFYDGEFRKDKACGRGAYYSRDGNIYVGQWDNDKRNGRGTYTFANGSVYTGNWVDNNIHGKGKFDYNNGTHYRGEFDKNRKHGRGIFTWANLTIYKGEYYYDEIRGMGEMKYFKGHRYLGMWEKNKKNGFGTFFYVEGYIYEGFWKDDLRHGKGKMTWLPGSSVEESYDGDWDNDEKHGIGTYRFRVDEGTVYEGQWDRNTRQGFGTIKYRDGSFYRGDFRNEQMWGRGVYIHRDGSQYEGDWVNNMRHGTGTLMAADGTIYQGEFWNNMKQGKGMMINTDGSRCYGVWDCGLMVGDGSRSIPVGHCPRGGPTEITVKVFSF